MNDGNVQPQRRRRRRKGVPPYAKVTFQISEPVMLALKAVVAKGDWPSANAFVEEAIMSKLRESKSSALDRAYADALSDQAFVNDLRNTSAAFETTIGDGLAVADDDVVSGR